MIPRLTRNRRNVLWFLLFAGPNVILFAAFTFWPLLYTGYLSVHQEPVAGTGARFVGMAHFRRLWNDAEFWAVVSNTMLYAAAVVLAAQCLAFMIAHALTRAIPGRTLWRTLVFSPHVTTTAAAALIFVLLLDPNLGPLSRVYAFAGLDGWRPLATRPGSLAALASIGIWKEIAFASIFFVAALQTLPKDVYESAYIDGAEGFVKLRTITLPMLSPVIFFLTVSGFIAATKTFDTVAIMTAGGPVYPDSSLLVYHLYKLAFRDFTLGYASAFAACVFVALGALLALKFALARRFVHYDG